MKLITPNTHPLGFTFLEMLITLSITMILIGVSFTFFPDFLANNRVSNQMGLLHRTINLSRLYAINNSNFVTLCSLKNNTCEKDEWVQSISAFIDNDKSKTLNNNEKIIFTFSHTHTSDSLYYPRTAITFRPDGSLNALNNGTFIYCPNYKKASLEGLAITVSQTGRVRVKSTSKCQKK
jgi:type IV fimbrial biogenesis protein FimT